MNFYEGLEYELLMTCGHPQKRIMSLEKANFLNDSKITVDEYLNGARGIGLCIECNKQDATRRGFPSGTVLY